MKNAKQFLSILAGFVCIAIGVYFMYDFVLKFLKFIIGLILFSAGIGLILRRKYS